MFDPRQVFDDLVERIIQAERKVGRSQLDGERIKFLVAQNEALKKTEKDLTAVQDAALRAVDLLRSLRDLAKAHDDYVSHSRFFLQLKASPDEIDKLIDDLDPVPF